MNISQNGIELIKKFEGFSAVPYKDTAGYLTIGFGHKVVNGEVFGSLGSMEATALLMKDIQWAVTTINKAVEVQLTQNQFDALVCFVYNVGAHNFCTSTMLKKINEQLFGEAANEFLKWCNETVNGKEVKNKGLYSRRQNEREYFLTGKTL